MLDIIVAIISGVDTLYVQMLNYAYMEALDEQLMYCFIIIHVCYYNQRA